MKKIRDSVNNIRVNEDKLMAHITLMSPNSEGDRRHEHFWFHVITPPFLTKNMFTEWIYAIPIFE